MARFVLSRIKLKILFISRQKHNNIFKIIPYYTKYQYLASLTNLARLHLNVVDPDYYNWETHILFDDCMELSDHDEEKIVNKFVKQLVSLMDEAASRHYGKPVKVKPCKKYPTPYGGRLVWTLPGKTKIVCHLKVSYF